jgi:hypothetical protein
VIQKLNDQHLKALLIRACACLISKNPEEPKSLTIENYLANNDKGCNAFKILNYLV